MTSDPRTLTDALLSLFADAEFATRMRILAGRSLHGPVVRYLRARGVSATDAEWLCMAYLAGAIHTAQSYARPLERIAALVDAVEKA